MSGSYDFTIYAKRCNKSCAFIKSCSVLRGTLEDAEDELDRSNRYQIARSEGDKVDEHLGILHTAKVPEFNRARFYACNGEVFECLGEQHHKL